MTYGGCCLRYPAWRCSNLNLRTALSTPQTMPTVELRHESSHLAGNFATGNGERAIDVNAQMRGFAGMVSCWRSLLVGTLVPLVGVKWPRTHHRNIMTKSTVSICILAMVDPPTRMNIRAICLLMLRLCRVSIYLIGFSRCCAATESCSLGPSGPCRTRNCWLMGSYSNPS